VGRAIDEAQDVSRFLVVLQGQRLNLSGVFKIECIDVGSQFSASDLFYSLSELSGVLLSIGEFGPSS